MPYKDPAEANAQKRRRYKESPEIRAKRADYQRKNKEIVNARHRAWREKNRGLVRIYNKKWENRNKDRAREYRNSWQKKKRASMRLEALAHYGGRCVCCGEKNEVFLAFDHINGGGVQHIKALKKQNLTLVKWIHKNNFPNKIQLLCHNCNYAKHRLGECPGHGV